MREMSCKACGREIKSIMKFCPYCGSTELINSAFNNPYSSNSVLSQNNQYSSNYQNSTPRNNYSNNMFNNNSIGGYNGHSGNMYMNNNQRVGNNPYKGGYGNSGYNNNYEKTENQMNNNPYVTNKNFYTNNHHTFNSISSQIDDDDMDDIKKDIAPWKLGLGVFAIILMVGLGVLYLTGTFDGVLNKSKTESSKTADNSNILTGSGATEYEIGELKDNTYTNKWSNVVIKIPEGYSNKSEEGYNMYKTEYMDCGLYLENSTGESIVNLYVDLTNDDGTFSESAFIEESKTNYKTSGMEIASATEHTTTKICGNDYTYSHIVMKSGEVTITQSIYVRKQDNNACIFIITNTGENTTQSENIINSFTQYK